MFFASALGEADDSICIFMGRTFFLSILNNRNEQANFSNLLPLRYSCWNSLCVKTVSGVLRVICNEEAKAKQDTPH